MLKHSTILFLLIWSSLAIAQNPTTLSGQVLDEQSQELIPFVHVVGSDVQAISDSKGYFTLKVEIGDTLIFSHINFDRFEMTIFEDISQVIRIHLKRKENLMQEIIVRDFLPEEELKQEMIDHKVNFSAEEINAINNVEFSTILYKSGYVPEMNSLDNFKNYIKEPQGVTFFSSDPSKGLIKSIKRLNHQKRTLSGQTLNLNKTDTVKSKSLYQLIE